MVEIDQQREWKSFVLKRALLDVQMGQILAEMGVDHDRADLRRQKLGSRAVFTTARDISVIETATDCPLQKLQTD